MIGIMSALQEEIQALHKHIQNLERYTKGKRTYTTGTLFGKDIVLVFSRIGKVASATTATQLINDFNLDELLFTGVAGAISPNLNIGDIVIGNRLVQYDIDTTPLFKAFEIPLLDKTYFDTNAKSQKRLIQASNQFLDNYNQIIPQAQLEALNIHKPKASLGDIASGDQFIRKTSQVDFITSNLKSVVCVEMEGASVAQVCYEYDIPFSIIRTISDKTNDESAVDFPLFIKNVASKYALEILRNYFK